MNGYRQRGATRGLFRSQVILCECLIELSDYKKIKELEPEIVSLSQQVALGDYEARWMAVRADCQVSNFPDDEGSLVQASINYVISLQMAMEYKQCAVLYYVADRIARRIRWLTKNGRSKEADYVLKSIVQSWLNDQGSDGNTFLEAENLRCSPQKDLSVIGRISSALGLP